MDERPIRPGAAIAAVLNMRDLGGWPVRDGRKVRYGMLYRSAALDDLDSDGETIFAELGIRRIYDLRIEAERREHPDLVPLGSEYVIIDVLKDSTDAAPAQLAEVPAHPELAQELLGGGNATELFEHGYREMVTLPSALEGYGRLFSDLSHEENRPALFHCTGGKDRTGWAAASFLTLLGVPNEVVMQEYLLTNDQLLPAKKAVFDRFEASGGDPGLLLPVFGVRKGFMDAALEEMRRHFGTIEGYFTDGLGLEADTLKELRFAFTETDDG